MRIRRREKDRSETAESGPPADLTYDQEGSRPPDPTVTTLHPEPGAAAPDAVGPGEPAPAPSAQGNAPSPESAQPAQPPHPLQPAETPPAAPDGSLSQVDAGVAGPPAQNGPSATATATATSATVAEPAHPDVPTVVPPGAVALSRRPRERSGIPGGGHRTGTRPVRLLPAAAPSPPPSAKAAMRSPSIGNDATELLNGLKPAPRELPG